VLSLRYYRQLELLVPREAIWSVFGIFYALMFLPVVLSVARPLLQRRRLAREAADVAG
jgi:hypothetical protein